MGSFRNTGESTIASQAWDLRRLARSAQAVDGVRRADLSPGDWLIVTTRNSTYVLSVLDDRAFTVSGGWFDRHLASPQRIEVEGCTFGGRAIIPDLIAAPGLFLELANGLRTTRIQSVQVVAADERLPVC